ncbi:MAP7 domain-containing protein 2a isoform X2 [Sphaeramia orbicularis]|uniref:MAP7 domain-containing protein 2a isoform X2 n=1 Tax=Sphaeramia orbicularis TaxID=375764 RepID=UPI00117E06EF|nr:MAP7 domain-containing protein 2-like isoform X2 [Sphaeramia orbicularis]
MAKTNTTTNAVTDEKMAPPSIALLPEKRSPTNGHSSPARNGKTTPSNTERKPHMNGHASPSHLPANVSNSHAVVEGYMKTDDRMRLAKERREERERSLAAREQLIREKERRARLQYERTVEERWRRLEEQRQKEELRRAAVEEKRRQQLEEERERLEALMRRSLERSLQLEQRTKRWNRGCPSGAGDSENASLPFSAASAFSHGIASPLPAVSESAPCSPHRSPLCGALNSSDHSRLQGGSQSTPNTPKKQRLRSERRNASPGYGSPVRRSESPASVNKHLSSPTASKLVSKMRTPSPSNLHQYHQSPTRHRANLSPDDKKVEKHAEQSKTESPLKKNANINSMNSNTVNVEITKNRSSKVDTLKADSSERNQSPERKNQMHIRVDSLERKIQVHIQEGDKKKESAPGSTGKLAAGTTNAEEATKLLAERRRQARAQKELEEKKREEEEDRLKEEQLWKEIAEEQRQQEAKAQQMKEERKKEEDIQVKKKEEEKQKAKDQEKELQAQNEKEKEKAKVQTEEAERQRQDRELQKQQEEEERQLRKKRIEEIMKRTRKGEADVKKEEQVETRAVSPPGEIRITVQTNAQVNEQTVKKVEFQVKDQGKIQSKTKDNALVKREETAAAAQTEPQRSIQVKNNTLEVAATLSVPDKRQDTKENKASGPKRQEKEVEVNANKQYKANGKATDQINKESTKTADAKVNQKEGEMVNGAVKGQGSALKSSSFTADVSKQLASTAEGKAKGKSQVEAVRPTVTPLPVGHLAPPIIKLEPLDVTGTGSGDDVQSMEVSPASKEELISIPEFSPIIESQLSSMSNTRALEDLMDLTGSVSYPKLSSENNIGDCNRNLIEGVVSPMSDSKLIGVSSPSSNKLTIK